MKLSPNESRLLALLPEDGSKVSTDTLAKRFFKSKIPFNGRVQLSNLCRTLEGKSKLMRDIPRVYRGKRTGPKSMEIWRAPAKQ